MMMRDTTTSTMMEATTDPCTDLFADQLAAAGAAAAVRLRQQQQQQQRPRQQQQQRPWCTYECVHAHSAADHHAPSTSSATECLQLPLHTSSDALKDGSQGWVQDGVCAVPVAASGQSVGGVPFPALCNAFLLAGHAVLQHTVATHTRSKPTHKAAKQARQGHQSNPHRYRPLGVLHIHTGTVQLPVGLPGKTTKHTRVASATPEPAYACTRIIRGCIQSMHPSWTWTCLLLLLLLLRHCCQPVTAAAACCAAALHAPSRPAQHSTRHNYAQHDLLPCTHSTHLHPVLRHHTLPQPPHALTELEVRSRCLVLLPGPVV